MQIVTRPSPSRKTISRFAITDDSTAFSVTMGADTDHLELDLYDAETLRYRHTIQFPLDPGTAEYDGHLFAVARDTSVVLYRLSPID